MQLMSADCCFVHPDDARDGIAALTKRGFEIKVLEDWIDEAGPTVFIRAWITIEIDEGRFFDWVQSIVDPLGGDTIEAGPTDEASLADNSPPQ